MKARVPMKYQSGRAGERYRATRLIFLLVAYVLSEEFGFGTGRINRALLGVNGLIERIGSNPTWVDELAAWAHKKGIEW